MKGKTIFKILAVVLLLFISVVVMAAGEKISSPLVWIPLIGAIALLNTIGPKLRFGKKKKDQ